MPQRERDKAMQELTCEWKSTKYILVWGQCVITLPYMVTEKFEAQCNLTYGWYSLFKKDPSNFSMSFTVKNNWATGKAVMDDGQEFWITFNVNGGDIGYQSVRPSDIGVIKVCKSRRIATAV